MGLRALSRQSYFLDEEDYIYSIHPANRYTAHQPTLDEKRSNFALVATDLSLEDETC